MRNKIFEEDRMLTKVVETPNDKKPRFNWAEALETNRFEVPKVRIMDGAGDRDFHIAEVAEVIGEALTNLMISREENEILMWGLVLFPVKKGEQIYAIQFLEY